MYKLQKKLDAEKQKSFSVNDGNMDSGVGKPLWGPSYRTVDYTVYSLTGSGESNREYQTWSGLQTSDGKYNLRDRINSPLSDEWKKKIDELLHLVDAVDEMETGGLGLVHTEQDKVYMVQDCLCLNI
ncbi:uncharacterized protein LOC133202531 [Saccostrea echinata]|uniref:uncharacterized protein LOC133202531 n=1 Tax=Saccostrea echinata TaxID=191078 RepID=UPI002A81DE44|nr:uncharacterized protein LOC133202531 [Saccostrea echinata]